MNRVAPSGTLRRTMALRLADLTPGQKSVRASLSSEEPVRRSWGSEVLSHRPEAIDLGRAQQGLPLLFNHDQSALVGRVHAIRLDSEGRLVGDLVFKDSGDGAKVWEDVRGGWLRDVSIGYIVHEWDSNDAGDEWRARKWELLEVSVVTVPADASVGINRSRGDPMSQQPDGAPVNPRDGGTVVALESERERMVSIRQHSRRAAGFGIPALDVLEDRAVSEGWSADRYGAEILRHVQPTQPIAGPSPDRRSSGSPFDQAGEDALDKFARGVELCVGERNGVLTGKDADDARGNQYRGWSLRELARESLRLRNVDYGGDAAMAVFQHRSPMVTHSPGDFVSIMANVAGKSLRSIYEELMSDLSWCATVDVPDFKSNYLVNLSAFSSLVEVPASGSVPLGTIGDKHETLQAKEYGRLLTISRVTLINDDVGAFSRIPRAMAQAAYRNVAGLVYAKLTGGTALTMTEDSAALFVAGHSNYIASGAGAAPSVTTLNTARAAMRNQKDNNSVAFLNLEPAFLIVPPALEGTALTLVASETNPAGATAYVANPEFMRSRRLRVVVDPRITTAENWFLAADPGQIDTVVIGYVQGRRAPELVEEQSIGQSGTIFRVLHDVGVGVGDWRGLYFNYGS
jgi:HK97 family phage prohead protease